MPRFLTLLAVAVVGTPAVASPRDELLRAAPPDAALVFVVQNARDHARQVAESPFTAWFPTTPLAAVMSPGADLKAFGGNVLAALDVTPEQILDDVMGDAFAFAFTPSPTGDEKGERAVILVRPRKPATLSKLIDNLNAMQLKSGEIKSVAKREHAKGTYHARIKPNDGPAEFYCFRGGVFAFSSNEADIKDVLERDLAAQSVLSTRVTKLGVADAVAFVLINPRALDAELQAKVGAAKGDDRAFLDRFAEVWNALDAAAFYVHVGADIETGVSVQFRPGALSPRSKGWLTGSRNGGAFWSHVPPDAMLAVGGRFQATELIDGISSLLPEAGRKSLRSTIDDVLGPLVGRDKLPAVLGALGPDWGVFVGSPPSGGFLPTIVAGVHVEASGAKPEAAKALLQAVDYGFMTAKIAYNASHPNQLELRDTRDGDVVIKSLVCDKVFPPGVQPSFGLKGGYLLIASTPDGIKNFAPRPGVVAAESTIARFSGTATRAYFKANREKLAKFLADAGAGTEKDLLEQFDHVALVLEPLDRVEIVTRGDDSGMKVALRVKLAKSLKK